MALTPRQQAFVDAYAGNAAEAARKAGYSGATARQAGARLLTNVDVAAAIKARQDTRRAGVIATREERQAFWSDVMLGKREATAEQLKASELLGKSEADFTEKHEVAVNTDFAEQLKEARGRAQRR